jgi:hypothetical protein
MNDGYVATFDMLLFNSIQILYILYTQAFTSGVLYVCYGVLYVQTSKYLSIGVVV